MSATVSSQLSGGSDRQFGLVFFAFFALIGLYPLFKGHSVRVWAFVPSLAFLVLALSKPSVLHPLNRIWTAIGLIMHRVMSPVMLGVVFFAVITPMGLLKRIFSPAAVRAKFDPSVKTYWIERSPPGPAPDSLGNQF